MRHRDAWRDLDRADLLAQAGTDGALREAISIATMVWHVAEATRSDLEPSPWDGGAWGQWTLVMTRASVLLLRCRQALREREREQAAWTGGSGVRPKLPAVPTSILVVEPDESLREQLRGEAESSGAELILTELPEQVDAIRKRENPPLVVCRYPLGGAHELVSRLRRERAPVAVMTSAVAEAVAAFGVGVPIVPSPVRLVRLLEVALDIATGSDGLRPVTELPVVVSAHDDRRE